MKQLYIGLISGTSIDCIDAALVDCSEDKPILLAHHEHPIDDFTKQAVAALCLPGDNEIDRMGELDLQLGGLFADAAKQLLVKAKLSHKEIVAIGSHGQTIRHRPPKQNHSSGFTLQIGDANTIAEKTHITTVADFRRRDMAAGGQGAPFAPAFHQAIAPSNVESSAFLNLGGIANITLVSQGNIVSGFDTGPANGLMDAWVLKHKNAAFDHNGDWARSGKVNKALLADLKAHPYFSEAAPKSTGREEFHLPWLESIIENKHTVCNADVQATLMRLSCETIIEAVFNTHAENDVEQPSTLQTPSVIYCCGGGARNTFFLETLQSICDNNYADASIRITTTNEIGIGPDWIEACLFAWLAKQRLDQQPITLSNVTGASHNVIAGCIYSA
ncbi:MAG: anhydro-N-acetylmuramic acid kinase [Cellvibrionales bacterium]|jgi:anhydro-N-acetylmuramic acid kinase|nr:anhydro-N-acetylmuramic acid kinase [Cellvibrionales bacterium]